VLFRPFGYPVTTNNEKTIAVNHRYPAPYFSYEKRKKAPTIIKDGRGFV
jgi:hypothetical protein